MKRKLTAAFLLLLCLTGCSPDSDAVSMTEGTAEKSTEIVDEETTAAENTEEETDISLSEKNVQQPDINRILEQYDYDEFPECIARVDWQEVPYFTNAAALNAYLSECYEQGMEVIPVLTSSQCGYPDSDVFFKKSGMMWTQQNAMTLSEPDTGEDINLVTYDVLYSSGFLALYAYRTGDDSRLDETDREVYTAALSWVENELDKTASPLQQEKQIHDYLCDSVEYYDEEVPGDSRDRFRMAAGALLDGSANCMGYSDAFYLLAGMAGMKVETDLSRMIDHMWDLIWLNGKWYIVDVTWDDADEDIPRYEYFNAGLDVVTEDYILEEDSLTEQVQPQSDGMYYYFADEEGFGGSTDTREEFFDALTRQLEQSPDSVAYALCRETISYEEGQDFIDALSDRMQIGMRYDFYSHGSYSYGMIKIVD